MQPPGGVDQHDVDAAARCPAVRRRTRRWPGRRPRDRGRPRRRPGRPRSRAGRRPRPGRCPRRRAATVLSVGDEHPGELARRRGLAGAVDADHEHDRRPAARRRRGAASGPRSGSTRASSSSRSRRVHGGRVAGRPRPAPGSAAGRRAPASGATPRSAVSRVSSTSSQVASSRVSRDSRVSRPRAERGAGPGQPGPQPDQPAGDRLGRLGRRLEGLRPARLGLDDTDVATGLGGGPAGLLLEVGERRQRRLAAAAAEQGDAAADKEGQGEHGQRDDESERVHRVQSRSRQPVMTARPGAGDRCRPGEPSCSDSGAQQDVPMRAFEELVAEAESADVTGWGFGWLTGRATEERPPWGYSRLLSARLAQVRSALDIDTGGGEVIAQARVLPGRMCVTEAWPPNAQTGARSAGASGCRGARDGARRRASVSGRVVRAGDREAPGEPGLAGDQAGAVPGGHYFGQHVGPGSAFELIERFLGPLPEHRQGRDPHRERSAPRRPV